MSDKATQQSILPATHFHQSAPNIESSLKTMVSNKKLSQNGVNDMAQKLNQGIIESVSGDIIHNKITISEQPQKSLSFRKNDRQQKIEFHALMRRKNQLKEQMKRLQYLQNKSRLSEDKKVQPKMRSQYTEEQHQKISKILQDSKRLQQQIRQKNKRLYQQLRAQQQIRLQEKRKKLQQLSRMKKQKLYQNLKQQHDRKQSRQRQIKSLNKNYKMIKKSQFLHEKIENNWKNQQMINEQERKKILNERKKNQSISFQSIHQHQNNYKALISKSIKEKQQIMKEVKKQKQIIEQQTLALHQPSKFLKNIFQQQQRQLIQKQKQNQIHKHRLDAKAKYAVTVRQINKQKINKKVLPQLNQLNPQNEDAETSTNTQNIHKHSKSLSRFEIASIGNRYLREVHSSIKNFEIQPEISRTNTSSEHIKYKDYLQDLKAKRGNDEQNGKNKDLRQLKQILQKKVSDEQKLYKSKLILGKIKQRGKSDTLMLLTSINAKLAIINQFTK